MLDTAIRAIAVFLVLTAAAVGLNLILTPVYHDGSPEYPVWRILNWFMAAGVLICLVVSSLRRRDLASGEASTLEHVSASAAFYLSIALAMLFFWEWFWTLNPDSETGDAVTSHVIYFPIVDALYVAISLAVGGHMWNGDRVSES